MVALSMDRVNVLSTSISVWAVLLVIPAINREKTVRTILADVNIICLNV